MFRFYRDPNRKYKRVVPDQHNPIRVDLNGDNFIDIIKAKDISLGGVGIFVPYKFEGCKIDKVVSMIIELPAPVHCSFTVPGQIVHVTGEVFGGIFLDMDSKTKKNLKNYIKFVEKYYQTHH